MGNLVGENGIKPLPDKVKTILEAPIPQTKKQVRSFLGLSGFYRRFVPSYAELALPLTDLTRKGPNKVVWDEPQDKAFQRIKAVLCAEPVLMLPDLSKQFILRTDASDCGLGAMLLQEDQEGNKRPVAYASKKLLDRERHYSTIEKEWFAIVWGISKF